MVLNLPNEENGDAGVVLGSDKTKMFLQVVQSRLSNGISIQLQSMPVSKRQSKQSNQSRPDVHSSGNTWPTELA